MADWGDPHPLLLRLMAVDAARQRGIPPDKLLGLFNQESTWNPAATNKGAVGLGQLRLPAASEVGIPVTASWDQRFTPGLNIAGSADYLRSLYDKKGNWDLALGGYNQGGRKADTPKARAYAASVNQKAAEEAEFLPTLEGALDFRDWFYNLIGK